MRRRRCDDLLERFESRASGDQRDARARSGARPARVGIAVARCRADSTAISVETLVRPAASNQLPAIELHVAESAGALRCVPRSPARPSTHRWPCTCATDARSRSRARSRRCPCRGPRHAPCACRIEMCQRAFDHQLGLRPRNQHRRAHFEQQRPELLLAADVCNRLALQPTLDELLKRPARRGPAARAPAAARKFVRDRPVTCSSSSSASSRADAEDARQHHRRGMQCVGNGLRGICSGHAGWQVDVKLARSVDSSSVHIRHFRRSHCRGARMHVYQIPSK